MADELARLIDGFLTDTFTDRPVLASGLGVEGYDDQLGDFSAGSFENQARRDREWYGKFDAVPAESLDFDDRIDLDLIRSSLRGRILLADRLDWRREPLTYVGPCFSGILALFIHRLRPEPELVTSAVARLRAIPGTLAAARANIDPSLVSPLMVGRAQDQVRAGRRFVTEVVPGYTEDPELRARLADAGAPAADAFDAFGGWLTELAETASGDWVLGADLYSALLRERELLGFEVAELRERGRVAYAELDDAMREVAARVPGGNPDWHQVMAELNRDHPPTPDAMLAEYDAATRSARRFLVDHDLVSFSPAEQCLVVPAPEFQRAVLAVASYMAPPSFTTNRIGHFFVPFPPDSATADQVNQRLTSNSRASIPTIAAHETYPGHHWHLSWAANSTHPIRKVLRTPYFSEGWALYSEAMMREHGFFTDPRHELAHLEARILRAARIIVDTSLHTGEMGFDEAVDFMTTNTALPRETAWTEVRRYCAWPTQAAAYLTGAMQIARIRDTWREAHPDAPLRDFHDRIAANSGLPLGLAERVALHD